MPESYNLLEHIRQSLRRVPHLSTYPIKQFHSCSLKRPEYWEGLGTGHDVLELFRRIERVEDFDRSLLIGLKRHRIMQPQFLRLPQTAM